MRYLSRLSSSQQKGRRLQPNRVALDFFGWTIQEFLDDEKVKERFHPDDRKAYFDVKERGISSGVAFQIEARILRKDGQYRWFLFLYTPYRNEHGEISFPGAPTPAESMMNHRT